MILRQATYRRTAWKNGGGTTRDIVDDGTPLLRRLSLASIDRDGPFSDFSGCDRTLVLASDAGIVLSIDGTRVVLDAMGARAAFAGEAAVTCALLDGEAQAFNVVTRRGVYDAAVDVHRIDAGPWIPPRATSHVFLLDGTLDAPDGTAVAHDTIVLERQATLHARTACRLVGVSFLAQPNVVRGFPSA